MLPKSALDILEVIVERREVTVKELVEETGYSKKQIYRTVDVLIKIGEISEARGRKQQRELRPASGRMTTAYQHLLVSAGHVDWRDLLTPSLLRVCWYLDEPRQIATIAARLGRTERAVYSALEPIKGRAMLSPSGPEYALADNIHSLHQFAGGFVWQSHRRRTNLVNKRGIIEWYEPNRVLVRPKTAEGTSAFMESNDWHLTGVAALEQYGHVFYLPGEPLFWYGPHDGPSGEEIVCHVIQSDSEPRRVSYAMLHPF